MSTSRDSSEDFFNSFGNSPAAAAPAVTPSSTASTKAPPPPPPGPPPPRASTSTKQSSGGSYYSNNGGSGGGSSYYGASSSTYPSASSAATGRSTTTAAGGSSYYGTSSAYNTPAPAPPAPSPTPAPASDTDWYGVPSSTTAAAPAPSASTAAPAGAGMAFYSTAASTPATGTDTTPPTNTNAAPAGFSGTILSGPMGGAAPAPAAGGGTNMYNPPPTANNNDEVEDYENEPPLMEELGINIDHIITKLRAVVLPVGKYTSSHIDETLMEDTDMAGPLAFALLLGGELLLSGKVHFGYIYGFGMSGCLAMSLILNLMSPNEAISVWTVISILGYALLPVNVLAGINILLKIQKLGLVGMVMAGTTICWCTVSSTRLFEKGCGMRDQRYLVAYPVALLYSAFVMITIF